jgi:hypothetical protein
MKKFEAYYTLNKNFPEKVITHAVRKKSNFISILKSKKIKLPSQIKGVKKNSPFMEKVLGIDDCIYFANGFLYSGSKRQNWPYALIFKKEMLREKNMTTFNAFIISQAWMRFLRLLKKEDLDYLYKIRNMNERTKAEINTFILKDGCSWWKIEKELGNAFLNYSKKEKYLKYLFSLKEKMTIPNKLSIEYLLKGYYKSPDYKKIEIISREPINLNNDYFIGVYVHYHLLNSILPILKKLIPDKIIYTGNKNNDILDIIRSPLEQISFASKQFFRNSIFEVTEITQEKIDRSRGVFLVKSGKIKVKGIVFSDREEIINFTKYVPLIKRAPKILFKYKNCVITEWLDGEVIKRENISDDDLKEIAKLQAGIHKVKVRIDKNRLRRKIDRWFEKFLKYASINSALANNEISKIRELYYLLYPEQPRYSIIHGDFNLDNIIKTKKGWFAMDNESIDVFLTGFDFGKPINNYHLTEKQRAMYLSSYSQVLDASFYTKNEDFYQLIFLVRILYSKLKNKRNAEHTYELIRDIIKRHFEILSPKRSGLI